MKLAAGTKLGRYTILSELGFGGMGEVYLAQDENLGRPVALKILSSTNPEKPGDSRRFIQEARTVSVLKHPNIAHIYEIGVADGLNFIAMEYVEGTTLRQHMHRELPEIIDISIQVVDALVAAHRLGIVHRDLKPENIMLSRDGYIKVLDFGLAKRLRPKEQNNADPDAPTVSRVYTNPGSIIGTVTYMSPEQARGLTVDLRTDIWSVGVIMYEMISGRVPFEANTASDVISMILHREPAPLARFSREVPDALEWLVMKALIKDQEGRYQTAKEMLSDLRRLKRRLDLESDPGALVSDSLGGTSSREGSLTPQIPRLGTSQPSVTRPTVPMSSVEYIVTGIASHKRAAIISVLSILAVAVALVVAFRYFREPPSVSTASGSRSLSRLTSGSGLQTGPSWSPDGRFIAYTSDRSGGFGIWVQPVGGGDPVQVTHSAAQDWQPDWSPDGNSIVFRSEREGGGLYVIPAFGGLERKIANFGYRPRWSPDGKRVLCLSPGDEVYTHPKVFVVNLDGSPPIEVSTTIGGEKHYAKQGLVAWHPDGQRISFLSDKGGFWTIPITGGQPIRSEIATAVTKQIESAAVEMGNFCWAASGHYLFFEGDSKGVSNLWRITVDPKTLAWTAGPERLTTGLGRDTELALSKDGKRLAFATVVQNTRIWSLPFDAVGGRTKGSGQPLTVTDMDAWFPDLSPDGKKLVFAAWRPGMDRQELWQQSLTDNSSKLLAVDEYTRIIPRWAPDGKRLAYTRFLTGPQNDKPYVIALLPTEGGDEQLLTSGGPWRDYVYDWSPDGQWIVGSTNRLSKDRWQLALFPLSAAPHAETEMRIVASAQDSDLWAPRFSPDGRWICYLAQKLSDTGVSVINVVRSTGGPPIPITNDHLWSDKPRWSPDGKTIYFISNHGSMFLNVWGIHFDPNQGTAAGEPFQVTGLESPGQLIPTRVAYLEMALDQTRLLLPVTQVSGSVWVLEGVDR